jgi:hypothetical protein
MTAARRVISRDRLPTMRWVAVLAAVLWTAVVPSGAAAITGFHSPSGNIRCNILKSGVRCDITQHGWQSPPKPNSCEFDWGGSIGLSRHGAAHFLCVSDATEQGAVLAYGDSITRHRFRCKSLISGIRCTNKRNGHGFKLSRQSYRFF